jgi:predicted Zn-dependent peptidase
MQELRERRGLVYSVFASPAPVVGGGALGGAVQVYAATAPERAQDTLDALAGECQRLRLGVSEAELERARVGAMTNLVMNEESAGARARGLLRDWLLFGRLRPLDEVKAALLGTTVAAVNSFVHDHPLTDPVAMTVGPVALDPATLGVPSMNTEGQPA